MQPSKAPTGVKKTKPEPVPTITLPPVVQIPVVVNGQPVSEFSMSYVSPTCRAHLVSADGGTHELGAVFYGRLNEKGDQGFRPNRLGRFAIQSVEVGPDRVTLCLEGGNRVQLHPSQVTVSYRV